MSVRYSIYIDFDEQDEIKVEDAIYTAAVRVKGEVSDLADAPVRVTVGDGIATIPV